MRATLPKPVEAAVVTALRDCRRNFVGVALFSALVNLLMLAGPLYMLQVYDRVLTSRSVPTLVALTIFLIGAYTFQGILDLVRSRVVVRSAALLDERLGKVVHRTVIRLAAMARQPAEASQPLRDLDQVRAFLTGNGPIAIIDLPWMPIFLFVCWLIHPWLGYVAAGGGVILFAMTLLTEFASRGPVRAISKEGAGRASLIEAARRNSETVTAMGMVEPISARWLEANDRYVLAVQKAADVTSTYSTVTRAFRFLLQSLLLGVGAYLVIHDELMPGAMIAASIMMGRALAPLETAIANWRGFVSAREGARRLQQVLAQTETRVAETTLPRPGASLSVEHLTVVPPGTTRPVLANVTFSLQAGEALGVIGPSGAGKTSLLRALTGVWAPARGSIRLDGASLAQWRNEDMGRYVGYLPQTVELFEGSVRENISRMSELPDDPGVLSAAAEAGADELIRRFPAGYDTPIGEGGRLLSAGQRQRIALARALYGEPFLVLLDEPNSNLDGDGDIALHNAVRAAKARGAIVIVVAHRPSAVAACDKILALGNGIQQDFGPRDEVLQRISARPPQPVPMTGSALRVVSDAAG